MAGGAMKRVRGAEDRSNLFALVAFMESAIARIVLIHTCFDERVDYNIVCFLLGKYREIRSHDMVIDFPIYSQLKKHTVHIYQSAPLHFVETRPFSCR